MASGGDAGNAEKKAAKKDAAKKDNKLAGRVTVRKPDSSFESQANNGPSVQDSNDSYGLRNVNHRGAQLHDSELTESQRLQLEMKKMSDRIEALRTGQAPEAASSATPSYQSHPLDDLETAQVSSEFTQNSLPAPSKYRKPDRFVMDPHTYLMDFKTDMQTAEYLKKLNTHEGVEESGTWYSNCFPSGDIEPMGYYSPFPGQSANLGVCDVHIATRPSTLSLNFTLDTADMTHEEFVEKYRNKPGQDGTVKLTIPMEKIMGILSAELSEIDVKRSPYHLHVLDIGVTEQISNFPVTFDKVFTSSSAVHEGLMNSWSTPRGVDANIYNLASAPGSDNSNRYYNLIHPDGESNLRRAPNVSDCVYIGEPCKNGAEFQRFINRDWKEIKHDLKKMERDNMYVVELPHVSKFKEFTFIQWFIFWNMKEIHRRTVIHGEKPDTKPGKDELVFNKMYSTDENHTSTHTLISKRVLDAMLKEKQALFDQEKHLMRLEKTQLILWPVQGWDTYANIASDNGSIMAKSKERVRFSCEITVTFEPYRQAMLLPSTSSSSSSSSSSHGKAHEAIANSFNSATS